MTPIAIPCLQDNFAYLVHHDGKTALIDAPEAAPILHVLDQNGWGLDEIWLTHHHFDHIDAVPELVARTKAKIAGNRSDDRLPALDIALDPGAAQMIGLPVQVIDVPGHTIGHLAFATPNAVFTGDSLMAMGCGRLFEGTPAQMYDSLTRLNGLDDDIWVCSGHDYLEVNTRFARAHGITQEAIDARIAASPAPAMTRLRDERRTNPFLTAPDLDSFTRLRAARDTF